MVKNILPGAPLSRMLKRSLPYALVLSVLILVGAGSWVIAARSHIDDQASPSIASETQTNTSGGQNSAATINNQLPAPDKPTPEGQTAAGSNNSALGAPTPLQPAGSGQNQAPISVSLSVDGGGSLAISLPVGSNQCDVLSRALAQGKISSLDMRFNPSYGSYGVFKINGLGQDSQVWWTYKVNGSNPNQGCSYIKANNNDQISWIYVGPR